MLGLQIASCLNSATVLKGFVEFVFLSVLSFRYVLTHLQL
jgi:hypothetical protein